MQPPESQTFLYLRVRNHPGVLSHVCGLFARRCFNLERIACVPSANPAQSWMFLGVAEDGRLEQIVRQLAKLEDVLEVRPAPQMAEGFRAWEEAVVRTAFAADGS